MSYLLTPVTELKERMIKLQDQLRKNNLDGAVLTKNVEIYYFSGTMQNSIMYIPAKGEPILFVKKSYERALEETPFKVEKLANYKSVFDVVHEMGYKTENIGTELDVLPYNQYVRLKKAFSDSNIKDVSPITKTIRSIKSNYELDILRTSAKIVNDAMEDIPNLLKVGMTELELSSAIEKFVRDRGHTGYIRTRAYNMELVLGMVASGPNASTATGFDGPAGGRGLSAGMPQSAGWKKINRNEPIILDIAAAYNGYIIDQTRMAVIGKLEPELEKAYQASLDIIRETERNAKPGTTWSEHYYRALEMAKEANLEQHFMGYKENQAKFLGHGVGLELDELPVLAKGLDLQLEEGMVIAIEPKFTFPDKGVIGIENTYVVTKDGLEHLSYAKEEIITL